MKGIRKYQIQIKKGIRLNRKTKQLKTEQLETLEIFLNIKKKTIINQ